MLIQLTGVTPLIMHNARLADPDDPFTRAISKITDKRTSMTDDDRLEKSRLQFTGSLYHDQHVGPYLPGPNIVRSLRTAGHLVKHNKGGGEIERGFILLTDRAPIDYAGPRGLDDLWGGGETEFVARRMVGIGKSKVPTTRPIFVRWATQFELDPNEIDAEDFQAYAEKAGKIGVGDGRKIGYGRFSVKVA